MTQPSLSDTEREVLEALRTQVHAYQAGTHEDPATVARWLRVLAETLDDDRKGVRVCLVH